MSDYTDRVERGARLLDARKPGWDALIDLDTFALADPACCVLGQIYGVHVRVEPFITAINDLFPDDPGEAIAHGFEVTQSLELYGDVEAEWRRLIESRRGES